MQTNELYRLFHKRWTQQITKEEAGQLSALLQDVTIRESHDQLYSYWLESKEYRPKTEFNAEIGLARFKERIALEQTSSKEKAFPKMMRMKPPIILLRLAAAILLILLCTFVAYNYVQTQTEELITTNSDVQFVQLADGSKVWLNVNSYLRFPKYNFGDRNVSLKGEAYFEVEPEADRPFLIKTPNADVKVIGTAFNLSSYAASKEFKLSVDEGIVEVSHDSKFEKVIAKEQFSYSKPLNNWKKSSLSTLNSGAWRNQILHFENTSLKQVFKDLETFFNFSFDTSGVNSLECNFTSPINRSVGDVIQALKSAYPDLVIDGPDNHVYIVSGVACN